MKLLAIAAFSFLALASCAGTGRSATGDNIAATQSITATPAPVTFSQADVNGDARIDRHEYDLWLRNSTQNAGAAAGGTGAGDAFDAADTNHNGVLTLDEWSAMRSR